MSSDLNNRLGLQKEESNTEFTGIVLSKNERFITIYHDNEIDEFQVLDFPRESVLERQRLKDLSIFFYRDAEEFNPIIGENTQIPKRCYVTMFIMNENGTVQAYHMRNRPAMMEWIKDGGVKRRFLAPIDVNIPKN